jgi:hypothetical protein
MDAGFRKWLGETRGFQQGDVIRTRDQFDALYRLYLNDTTGGTAGRGGPNGTTGAGGAAQQIMAQAESAQPDSGSAIGSWISSWFGGNDPGRPVAQAEPQATPVPTAGRSNRSASALLTAALQDAPQPMATPRPQLPTGGRVAFEEAMPMDVAPSPPPDSVLAGSSAAAAPTPVPSPTPGTFTREQFKQMTGQDLAPGEYQDAKGRPFFVN